MHYLIIGNSAAGIGAVEAIRRHDAKSSVTIISDEDYPVYSRCLLSYYIAGTIDAGRLRYRPSDFYQRMNVKPLLGRRVTAVIPDKQRVDCADGGKIEYDKLLIATGGSPKIPANIPADLDGVFVLRKVSDAEAIMRKADTSEHAVVLGGGLVGLKAAFALRKRRLKVTVVVRSPYVLSQMIDNDSAQIVMNRMSENGIDIQTGADVIETIEREGRLSAVKLERGGDTYEIPCDILIAAKGVRGNMDLIADTDIKREWGIITDSNMRTNVENIFAAGDVAETFDIAVEQHAVNALWTCAVQQGGIAGMNMAGIGRQYDGSIGMNSINFPGADLISFGVVRPKEGEGYETMTVSRPEKGIYKKLVMKDNRIKGMILVNAVDNAGILLSLLSRKADISGYRDMLLSDNFSYGRILGHGGEAELQRYIYSGQSGKR
ncbi:MAG: NAD(P)/FAD-dependent oxidoreductase [FCB group bacterium]|nr:NAD(P)/FAD-dependent oxidoreductase [FCB group bacterium]